MRGQNTTHEAGFYGLEHDTPADHGTTHLSVTDQWGGAVAMTSTVSQLRNPCYFSADAYQVNLIWGSRVMDPETGVIFNDELGVYTFSHRMFFFAYLLIDDFAVPDAPDAFGLQPSPWNYPAPGKRYVPSPHHSHLTSHLTRSDPCHPLLPLSSSTKTPRYTACSVALADPTFSQLSPKSF